MGNQSSTESLVKDETKLSNTEKSNKSSKNKSDPDPVNKEKQKSQSTKQSKRGEMDQRSKEKKNDKEGRGNSRNSNRSGSRNTSRAGSRNKSKSHSRSRSNDKSDKRPGPGTRKPPSPGAGTSGGNTSNSKNNQLGVPGRGSPREGSDDQHEYTYANAQGTTDENDYSYAHIGFKDGKQYYAMFDYEAQTPHHLSFKRKEMLVVVDQSNPEWWSAVKGMKRGFVPSNYLCENTLTLGPWYFKDCTRNDAERLLMNTDPGTFLIRNRDRVSKSSPSKIRTEFSLSLKVSEEHKVQHYKIEVILSKHAPEVTSGNPDEESNRRYYIDKRKRFKALYKLVKYYQRHKELDVLLKDPCIQDQPSGEGNCLPGLKDKWEISKDEITYHKVLGSGQFGEVWRGRWNNILDVAVKVLKSGSTMQVDEFLGEARVMKSLHHKHLVQLYGVVTSQPMCIVTELAEHGSLKDFLQKDAENLTTEFLTGIAGDVASGMAYLEAKDFIHRDLAARNVVVGRNTVCKICDFGLARWLKQDFYQARRGSKFPVRWTAPEAMLRGKFTIKSDVWSFGVLCYEIITKGQTPYKGMSNKEVMQFVTKEKKLEKPLHCPEWYYNIMVKCWRKDPEARPNFRRIQRVIHKNSADEIANSLDASDAERSSVERT